MCHYIVHDSGTPWEEFSKSIFNFSHLLSRGLNKGLSPNWAFLSTFLVEMHKKMYIGILNNERNISKVYFKFSHPLIRD